MIRFGLAVLALVLLPACSAIKLGYQQLPTLSYWWLDSTVSFSNAQTPAAKEAIDKLYQWHRREELAGYGEVLQRIGQLSTGPLQAEQVCSVVTDVQARLDVLMRQAVVQAAPVVLALGPRQLSHIARQWESKNEDWEKEWLQGDAQARLDRRLDKAVNRFNSFYGDLNPTQISMVRAQLAQSPWSSRMGTTRPPTPSARFAVHPATRGPKRHDTGPSRSPVVGRLAALADPHGCGTACRAAKFVPKGL
jgi:hypothetical protein